LSAAFRIRLGDTWMCPLALHREMGDRPFNLHHGERRMNWYLQALKKYADFSGRARRKEYWFFVLFYVIILVVLMVIDGFVGTQIGGAGFGILTCLYALAMLIPALAVTVRRLHDTGRSGWWILIQLVPLVGWIVLLIFLFIDSQPGQNAYGPSPKAGESTVANVPA
jgi:uncharacterized membrane protein YhaH (DUF805 family)